MQEPLVHQNLVSKILLYSILIFFALYFLFPMVVMLMTSLKTLPEIRSGNLLSLPKSLNIQSWIDAWGGLKGNFWNSIRFTVPAIVVSTSIGAINGYILSKWNFRGSNFFFGLLLVGCFIPFQTVILPMARTLGAVGLSGTLTGLTMVHIIYGIPFTTLFFRNFYVNVPTELVRAAQIDGAGFFTIFWKILVPISTPIVVVSVIWQFTNAWNDFLFGVVYTSGDNQPVTVALNNLVNTATAIKEYNRDMAAAFITALPTLLVYILAGKFFVRGLTAGALKG